LRMAATPGIVSIGPVSISVVGRVITFLQRYASKLHDSVLLADSCRLKRPHTIAIHEPQFQSYILIQLLHLVIAGLALRASQTAHIIASQTKLRRPAYQICPYVPPLSFAPKLTRDQSLGRYLFSRLANDRPQPDVRRVRFHSRVPAIRYLNVPAALRLSIHAR
jgi:hypothetical protein